ncbi:MAG: hypothetical protein AB1349_13920, partial [Elusimicrobiota bacterium]
DDEEDKKYGFDKRGTELPENIQDKEQRIKKMKQIVEQLKQARQKIKESGKKKINLTDEDAQFQKTLGDGVEMVHLRATRKMDSRLRHSGMTKEADQGSATTATSRAYNDINTVICENLC